MGFPDNYSFQGYMGVLVSTLDLEMKEAVRFIVDKAVIPAQDLGRGGLAEAGGSTEPDQAT